MEIANWLRNILINKDIIIADKLLQAKTIIQSTKPWSFSQEWKEFEENQMEKTWSLTAEERLQQFYIETGTDPKAINQLTILDAGCGNGLLSQKLSMQGANVLGVDIHQNLHSVAERLSNANQQLYFLQADINDLPLQNNSFDIIISNGVLHHTHDTKKTFMKLAKHVKEGGKLYIWLYKKPTGIKNQLLLFNLDLIRFVVSKFNPKLQSIIIKLLAYFFYKLSKIRKGRNSSKDYNDILIEIFDAFTPKFRHYHDPLEVCQWFFQAEFNNPVISHWDNFYGFGMCSIKRSQPFVPAGENFRINK